MKSINKTLMMLLCTFLITACGAGSGEDEDDTPVASSVSGTSNPTSQPVSATNGSATNGASGQGDEPTTVDLDADSGFDFRVSGEFQLNFLSVPVDSGALTIYHGRVDNGQDGISIDYLTRLTSVRPVEGTTISLEVNDNWTELLFHWVPEGPEADTVFATKFLPNQSSYDISF